MRLESQVHIDTLGDLADGPLERQLSDEELAGLLVLPDLSKSIGASFNLSYFLRTPIFSGFFLNSLKFILLIHMGGSF